jgi:hypothetical protein
VLFRFVFYSVISLFTLSGLAADWQGRVRIQQIQPQNFSSGQHTALQHRLLASKRWAWQNQTSVDVELISAFDSSEQNQWMSFEHNLLDIHQLVVKQQWQSGQFTIGRQVWAVGEQRLLGKREGTNVRRRFDGVLVQHQFQPELQLKLYQGYHVKSLTGLLDDELDKDLWVRGLVGTQPQLLLHWMQLNQHKAESTEQRFSYEVEYQTELWQQQLFLHAIYQQGQQGQQGHQELQQIQAWFTQFRLSHSWQDFTLAWTGSYASGGSAAAESKRFVAALAKAPYYSEAGLFATTNLRHVGVSARWSAVSMLQLELELELDLELDIKRLYRSTTQDGVFTLGKQQLPTSADWHSSPVADTFSFKAFRPLTTHFELELVTSLIQPRAGVGLPVSRFVELVLHYKF